MTGHAFCRKCRKDLTRREESGIAGNLRAALEKAIRLPHGSYQRDDALEDLKVPALFALNWLEGSCMQCGPELADILIPSEVRHG